MVLAEQPFRNTGSNFADCEELLKGVREAVQTISLNTDQINL